MLHFWCSQFDSIPLYRQPHHVIETGGLRSHSLAFKQHSRKNLCPLFSLPKEVVPTNHWGQANKALSLAESGSCIYPCGQVIGQETVIGSPIPITWSEWKRSIFPKGVLNRQKHQMSIHWPQKLQAQVDSQLASPVHSCSSNAQIVSTQLLAISPRRRILGFI